MRTVASGSIKLFVPPVAHLGRMWGIKAPPQGPLRPLDAYQRGVIPAEMLVDQIFIQITPENAAGFLEQCPPDILEKAIESAAHYPADDDDQGWSALIFLTAGRFRVFDRSLGGYRTPNVRGICRVARQTMVAYRHGVAVFRAAVAERKAPLTPAPIVPPLRTR